MAKHLGMSERTMIEKGLILGNSFQVIGRMIGRSPTTVSREVRKRRAFISRSGRQRNDCLHFISCLRKNLCPDETQYHNGIYIGMLLCGKLNAHLEEIDRMANEMFNLLIKQYAAREGVTEQIKAQNQMEWVRRMNGIRERVEDTIYAVLIYN